MLSEAGVEVVALEDREELHSSLIEAITETGVPCDATASEAPCGKVWVSISASCDDDRSLLWRATRANLRRIGYRVLDTMDGLR